MTRRRLILTVSWVLALLLLVWSLTRLPLGSLTALPAELSPGDWLVWAAINLAVITLAVLRWWQLGHALDPVTSQLLSFLRLLGIRQAGAAVSFITPGPHVGGEPLQVFWLSRLGGLSLPRALTLLGMDRFVELAVNVTVLLAAVVVAFTSALVPGRQWLIVGSVLAGALALMLACLVPLVAQPRFLTRRVEQLARRWGHHPRLSRLDTHWQRLGEILRMLLKEHRSRLLLALLLSVLVWGGLIGELWWLLRCLGVELSPSGLALILVAMRLAMFLPLPGGLGTVEAAVIWSCELLAVAPAVALGLIALMRLRDAVVLMHGFGCLAHLQRLLYRRPAGDGFGSQKGVR